MTTIAQIDGKWHVVQARVINGASVWYPVSDGYHTSEQARAMQADMVFGRI